MPGEPKRYPLRDIIAWYKSDLERQFSRMQPDEADMLIGADSPAQERYRNAKAQLAELDLAERVGQLIARSDIHEFLSQAAGTIRIALEEVQRRYGEGPCELFTQALDEVARLNEERFGNSDETQQPAAVS